MQKFNIKLILILGLVTSLILAANFFIAKEQEKLKRVKAEEELKITIDEKKVLEVKLDKEITEKEAVKQELVQEKKWSSSLEEQIKEKEKQTQAALDQLEEKEKMIKDTLAKFEEESRRSAKLEEELQAKGTKLTLLVKENKVLRERLRTKHSLSIPAIELEKIVVSSNPSSVKEGRVTLVNKEYNFVVIDLGEPDVKIGDIVSIFRDGQLIAKAEVEKIKEKISAARPLPEFQHVEIKELDRVRIP